MSIFSKVAAKRPKSSVFNLSHEVKLSCNFGDLVPILCQEVLPSDKFKISTELLIKLAPLKSPMMHRIKAYVHYFFVPTYQVNKVFESFINPKVNIDNSYVLPWLAPVSLKYYAGTLVGSLPDYLGLPILNSDWLNLGFDSSSPSARISLDPFRVYQHIYNSYYRDQNLENVFASNGVDGLFDIERHLNDSGRADGYLYSAEFSALLKLRRRAWAKDYFTSALPSPQAGDDVLLPISNVIEADGAFKLQGGSDIGYESNRDVWLNSENADDYDDGIGTIYSLDDNDENQALHYHSGLKATNSTATINDLRRAMALQRFKELAERGGTRYSEMVSNFFGAYLKDYWVDRPIYLGGQVQPIQVGEVVQTSMSTENTSGDAMYLGERGGIASSYGKTKTVSLSAPCHGYVMGILSIRPEAVYQQGLERMWTRQSIFDYAFPQFAKMGEQEIYNREIFASGSADYDDGVFGFTPRYAEYKVGHSHVCGEFRDTLNYWHLARVFDPNNKPTLSKEFVMMDSPSYAAFNVTDDTVEHCYVDLYNRISARRPLPYFGTPSII